MRRAALVLTAALLFTGCGSDEKRTSAEIQGTTSSSLFVADDQPDSCGVFTQAEVQAFTGNAVAKGTDTGAGQGCFFAAENDGTAMLINIEPGDSEAKFADAKSNVGEQTTNVAVVSGIGDEAFTYAPVVGGLASAQARKGSIRVRIVITGPHATVEAARTALAAAVPKVPST